MDTASLARLGEQCQGVLLRIQDALAAWRLPAEPAAAARELADLLGHPLDLVARPVGHGMQVIYLRTVVDERRLEEAVLRPLAAPPPSGPAVTAADLTPVRSCREAAEALLAGRAVVLGRGASAALAAAVQRWPTRSISEPPAEIVARGPHAGFVEDLATNLAQLRRGVPDPRLRVEPVAVWQRSGTTGAMVYVAGLAHPRVLAEVRGKLAEVDPSFATDSSMLAQWLSARAYLFPTVGMTERPDVAVAGLLEGRVLLLVEGSPVAVLVPQVFAHLLHVPADYYTQAVFATMERLLRMAGLLVALTASPLYVALTTVNLELIPTPLYVSLAQERLGVPLPTLAEVLILEVLVEVIRQAGLRMPSGIGQPVAIVGAVVIGQSAVFAGLVSAPAVVVVSLAFIISFIEPVPEAALAVRAVRYPLILIAAGFGLFGLMWALFFLLIYLSALESFGVPYLAPVTPRRPRGLQDTLLRLPLPRLRRSFLARQSSGRVKPGAR
jgi:spore germination protein KA